MLSFHADFDSKLSSSLFCLFLLFLVFLIVSYFLFFCFFFFFVFFAFFFFLFFFFFFFNDTATTEIYTLSLHDALPIFSLVSLATGGSFDRDHSSPGKDHCFTRKSSFLRVFFDIGLFFLLDIADRKSTRLNSSHVRISYAVFCLKKKKKIIYNIITKIK